MKGSQSEKTSEFVKPSQSGYPTSIGLPNPTGSGTESRMRFASGMANVSGCVTESDSAYAYNLECGFAWENA